MNRLCIYVIYDREKIIDRYIDIILQELRHFVSRLIVVCNFDQINSGYEYIEPYADEICFRENIGFDAGAYKDILLNTVKWVQLEKYDELLLTNDTYFGPLYSLKNMFIKMEEMECDFWGITRHPGGESIEEMECDSHIQSYFLNFKGRLLHSNEFKLFWSSLEYPKSFQEAIYNFELKINSYFTDSGYVGKAYMDCFVAAFEVKYGVNPYKRYALELIKDMNIPILKKKNFEFGDADSFPYALHALDYIDKYLDYDVSIIKNYLKRMYKRSSRRTTYEFEKMEKFVAMHEKIYIYGKGVWGINMAEYFKYRGWEYAGHLVTSLEGNEGALKFSETIISPRDGIVIALEKRDVVNEVYNLLLTKCSDAQILKPQFNL